MIPTRYKSKLPGDLSYPLGAQAVSEALAGVPQFDALTLTFHGSILRPPELLVQLWKSQLTPDDRPVLFRSQ